MNDACRSIEVLRSHAAGTTVVYVTRLPSDADQPPRTNVSSAPAASSSLFSKHHEPGSSASTSSSVEIRRHRPSAGCSFGPYVVRTVEVRLEPSWKLISIDQSMSTPRSCQPRAYGATSGKVAARARACGLSCLLY